MSHKFLDVDEIRSLLALAKDNKRDFALLHVAASTALRGSDILKLLITDVIDTDGEIIRSLRLKMKKVGRYVERPLRNDCRAALRRWLDSRNDFNPYLFCQVTSGYVKTNKPINRSQYHRAIHKYLALLYPGSELHGCSTHTLRRSVAKLVFKKTGKIASAAALLGHSNVSNTVTYIDAEEIVANANEAVIDLNY